MSRTQKLDRAAFIISLDVEMLWGHVYYSNSAAVRLMQEDENKCRGAVDSLLALFAAYDVPATWAVVGHLFLDRCEAEDDRPHPHMPRLNEGWYAWDPCSDLSRDPLWYGRDIVEKIASCRAFQEIGYHTFSHVPFAECSREMAVAEIREGIRLAGEMGIALRSFVFPENAVGHVDVLKEHGFIIYRGGLGGQNTYGRSKLTILRRAMGYLHAEAPPVEPCWQDGIWEIPGSMFFSSRTPASLAEQAKKGVCRTIEESKVFHLYLHPYNLLMFPGLTGALENLLTFVDRQRRQGDIRVSSMGEFANLLPKPGRDHE